MQLKNYIILLNYLGFGLSFSIVDVFKKVNQLVRLNCSSMIIIYIIIFYVRWI